MDQSKLILVIDDEAYFREIFSEKLKVQGFRVDTAEEAQSGFERAKALQPDLVLLDVKMPGMDGIQAIHKFQEDPATKNLKIVFLTNLGEAQSQAQKVDEKFSLAIGAIGYIKKSDDLDAVVQQIKLFLK